jgi:hypothetical protein
VIDQIHKEFENFFTKKESCDFTKISNSDDEVLVAIIKLIEKVHNLKEKASGLQTEDLSSTSKLLKFSLKLNETSSQIFSCYLEIVRKGYFNGLEIPHDSNVHEHVSNVCSKWRLIKKHEKYLLEPIKIACETTTNALERRTSDAKSPKSPKNLLSNTLGKKKLKNSFEGENISEEEMDISEVEKYKNSNSRKRAEYSNLAAETFAIEMIQKEDFEYSPNCTFAKYYLLIEEKLEEWLMTETERVALNSISLTRTMTRTLSNNGPTFKQLKDEFKIAAFLLNNFDYILSFVDEINVKDFMNKQNPKFESALKNKIEIQINKTYNLCNFLNSKWNKYKSGDIHISTLKRKEEFKKMFKETLEMFFKTVVLNKNSNFTLRDMVKENLGSILEDLDLSGDLGIILKELQIKNENYLENKKTYKKLVVEKIFPTFEFSSNNFYKK